MKETIVKRDLELFCKNLEAKLDLKDKVLQIYKGGDLLEIYSVDNLEDYWNTLEKVWEINLYRGNEGLVLAIYELDSYNDCVLVKLEVE